MNPVRPCRDFCGQNSTSYFLPKCRFAYKPTHTYTHHVAPSVVTPTPSRQPRCRCKVCADLRSWVIFGSFNFVSLSFGLVLSCLSLPREGRKQRECMERDHHATTSSSKKVLWSGETGRKPPNSMAAVQVQIWINSIDYVPEPST